jgi:hypothetical protein
LDDARLKLAHFAAQARAIFSGMNHDGGGQIREMLEISIRLKFFKTDSQSLVQAIEWQIGRCRRSNESARQ